MHKLFLAGIFVISLAILMGYQGVEASISDGKVASEQKISNTEGDFTGILDPAEKFGIKATRLGDVDGDGIEDIAVIASGDDDGCGPSIPNCDKGAVWILFLGTDGKVDGFQKISDTQGDFVGGISNNFAGNGMSVAGLGDLDGDNIPDLAVGIGNEGDGGSGRGAVWILFLNSNGKVKSEQKISDTQGDFGGLLDDFDQFGSSLANIGDLDDDGVVDLAVGARGDDDGTANEGALWILFLGTDGKVDGFQKISDTQGDFGGNIGPVSNFAVSIAGLGDIDGDGIEDIAVGENLDDDGGFNRGAVWILFLGTDGKVDGFQKISDTQGDFGGVLDNQDLFGISLAGMGDLDNDGINDLAVGARNDDDGLPSPPFPSAFDHGAVWILFLGTDGKVDGFQKISDFEGNFGGGLENRNLFGSSLANIGDLDNDGVVDLAVGAPEDVEGAVWILFLNNISPPSVPVGGELIPLDTTMVLVAGTQFTAAWLIPVLVSSIGIGIVISRKF